MEVFYKLIRSSDDYTPLYAVEKEGRIILSKVDPTVPDLPRELFPLKSVARSPYYTDGSPHYHPYTLLITEEGLLYGKGQDNFGRLGLGGRNKDLFNWTNYHLPLMRKVSVGMNHSVLIDEKSLLYITGDNTRGQLGASVPIINYWEVVVFPPVQDVSCGENFTLVVTEQGNLYATGNNSRGQLGLGDVYSIKKWEVNEYMPPVLSVSVGDYYSLLLTREGRPYGAGHDDLCRLGLTPASVFPEWTEFTELPNCKGIGAGKDYSIALTEDNELYATGCQEGAFISGLETWEKVKEDEPVGHLLDISYYPVREGSLLEGLFNTFSRLHSFVFGRPFSLPVD